MTVAPIALFVYNRLWHTQQTVEALANNELASDSELFVFSDGPRSDADKVKVESVREYLKSISAFKSVTIVKREKNIGCAQSIISGISEIVKKFGQIIVVEDDIITSPYFLRYMNEALEFYREEDRVACIHGYLYPVKMKLPETFFLKGADIWGWATWKRGWDLYESDAQKLMDELIERDMIREFDVDDSFCFSGILKHQIWGDINTWDIQWHASAFLKGKLTLYPGRSLVRNIGYDNSGTHCETSDSYDTELSTVTIKIYRTPIKEHSGARKAFRKFFRTLDPEPEQSLFQRTLERIKLAWGKY